jgi:hypothetical protein
MQTPIPLRHLFRNSLLVSVGEQCQPALQIHRMTGERVPFFFDWIRTPSAAMRSIFMDAGQFFCSGNWELLDQGVRFWDKATDLRFLHEFAVAGEAFPAGDAQGCQMIDVARVEGHLPMARAKFRHLQQKTLHAIRSAAHTILVRYEENTDIDQAIRLAGQIDALFGPIAPRLNILIVSPTLDQDQMHGNALLLKVAAGEKPSGDDADWDRIFRRAAEEWLSPGADGER